MTNTDSTVACSPVPTDSSTTPNVLEVLYGVLFHPVTQFQWLAKQFESTQSALSINKWLFVGVVLVLAVSGLSPLLSFMGEGGDWVHLGYLIPLQGLYGLFLWLLMAMVISLMAYTFSGESRFQALLASSAYATLPWLLLPPVTLIKHGMGPFGAFLGGIASLFLWFWTVALYGLAMSTVYKLSVDRTLLALLLPVVMLLVGIAWSWGFFINIDRIVP